MKKDRLHGFGLAVLLLSMLLLTACGAGESQASAGPTSGQAQQAETAEAGEETADEAAEETLADLCGADYQTYLIETITMQMGNRMEKDPEVRYYPIEDNAPLSDYVAIDETTKFDVDEEGNPVIYFPAGTVTDEANGEQSFRIPKLYF